MQIWEEPGLTRTKKDLLRWAKRRARENGLPFDITMDDIEIPSHCPVLGLALSAGFKYQWDGSPSLDRIESHKGYTKGNVIVISRKANVIKNDATPYELLKVAEYYINLTNERKQNERRISTR